MALHGEDYNLKILDLRNNKVFELKNLQYLSKLIKLEEFYFDVG